MAPTDLTKLGEGKDKRTSSHGQPAPSALDLSGLAPIFVLPTRLTLTELHDLEDQLVQHGGPMTYDPNEARICLGKVGTRQRAEFELRSRGIWTEAIPDHTPKAEGTENESGPPKKRRKLSRDEKPTIIIDDSSTEAESDAGNILSPRSMSTSPRKGGLATRIPRTSPAPAIRDQAEDIVRVVALKWFLQCIETGKSLSMDPFVIYKGRLIPPPPDRPATPQTPSSNISVPRSPATKKPTRKSPTLKAGEFRGILERARADAFVSGRPPGASTYHHTGRPFRSSRQDGRSWASSSRGYGHTHAVTRPTHLLQQTTSEHDEGVSSDLPEMPDWVKEHKLFACQRSTPPNPPNEDFMKELRKIRLARILTGDEIGVRAYSTSIASLAAYPHRLSMTKEILALPGCDTKIALLFQQWKSNEGHIQEVEDIENDEALQVLRLFYEIWGVGATTAREFYYERGWRDLDDLVEFGWNTLSRVQQIGVKYYDEFLEKIPRDEVEFIASKILEHARKVRDDGIEGYIVGGYRRGKAACGDVDMILSHRDEAKTLNLVRDVVISLEEEGWITHTLLLSLTNSKRDQQTLAFRPDGGGHGFDTLDKGLVVWQDIHFERAEGADENDKNPNVHRRVDIIISPWRTVGCAITGWSGETTFQRDLRRYARKVKGWKFDSSGIRDRATGHIVDLEAVGGVSRTWQAAEKKVFKGMGLVYREPWERCTG
ncbi:MAG: hypothetical protein M1816_001923 [Peltula sp. TS41687]|nr:MAG: hypothetical protein M1816_001923 [Peltula sp. TS41687]